jgi:cyclin H
VEEVGKFLSQEDEMNLVFYFTVKLSEFCAKFKPPMPVYVRGTSFQYFKRFYLNNSVMDFHPKEMLITAVYLACKTEEFNVSMQQFVANISGNQERATKIILNNELLLMQELQFHLTVHNPYRAVEGLLIDIKTRWLLLNHIMRPVQEGGRHCGGGGRVQVGD